MTDSKEPALFASSEVTKASTLARRNVFQAFAWIATHFEEVATAILLAAMLGSVGISVFWRFVLKEPLSWTEEVVLICMVWTCFLGASVVTKHREHIVMGRSRGGRS